MSNCDLVAGGSLIDLVAPCQGATADEAGGALSALGSLAERLPRANRSRHRAPIR
jgi:hypothetical protein